MNQPTFALLHPGVQRAIWEMGWKELRPIQAEAIHFLLEGNGHALICASTASGKTEAAFLPIISRLAEGKQDSVRAIYIGPLKALINDQFNRLDRLCERLELPVHRWHGDVSVSHKQALRRDPGGILLITPESLESNFINYGSQVPRLYRELEFIVIDEVHSFLGNVRGIHLLSLLSRLRAATGRQPRMIGLSATIGDPEAGKRFLAPDTIPTVTLIQETNAGRQVRFALKVVMKRPDSRKAGKTAPRLSSTQAREFVCGKSAEQLLSVGELPEVENGSSVSAEASTPTDDLDDIADDIVRHFATSTNLIFVNSRRTAEELAVRAHDRVAKLKWPHDPFMIHHGSIAKEMREETETALKSGVPTTAICSSTLEMGIDIGSVRTVGQIDPPWSVASLVQRLGRSGRREGEASVMRLYVREESPHSRSRLTDLLFPDLLRGIALTRLMQQKWLEPADEQRMHLSTLVHQIFSHLKQTGGMHTRVVQEMKAVLLETDEPNYLDPPARDLLKAARHVARMVGLDKGELLAASGGVRWFPWVGTRCLRTFSILAELNGVACETDRFSLWLPLANGQNFADFCQQLLNANFTSHDLGSKVTPRSVEKYDDFLPDDLLTKACLTERLALKEALASIKGRC